MNKRIAEQIKKLADPKKALLLKRFFKTGQGEYGEEDCFAEIKVPEIRALVKKFKDIPLKECLELATDFSIFKVKFDLLEP